MSRTGLNGGSVGERRWLGLKGVVCLKMGLATLLGISSPKISRRSGLMRFTCATRSESSSGDCNLKMHPEWSLLSEKEHADSDDISSLDFALLEHDRRRCCDGSFGIVFLLRVFCNAIRS